MTNGIRRKIIQGLAFTAISPVFYARAQNRPIRILVGFPPGGAVDGVARLLADKLPQELNQPVMVENRAGAGGRLAAEALFQSTDGSTYMVAPDASVIFGTLLYKNQIRWDLQKDFTGVGTLTAAPMGLAINGGIGAKNVQEFISWLRANPGQANVGVPGLGGRAHFLTYTLGKALDAELNVVAYKGTQGMVTDLLGGRLTAAVSLVDTMIPHHESGKLRVLGLMVPQRTALLPEIPTFAEQGADVTAGETWIGMWANAKAPAAETERVRNAVRKVLQTPEVVKAIADSYLATTNFRGSDEMRKLETSELTHWDSVVKASGFEPAN